MNVCVNTVLLNNHLSGEEKHQKMYEQFCKDIEDMIEEIQQQKRYIDGVVEMYKVEGYDFEDCVEDLL